VLRARSFCISGKEKPGNHAGFFFAYTFWNFELDAKEYRREQHHREKELDEKQRRFEHTK
jgi:hypothetical protein